LLTCSEGGLGLPALAAGQGLQPAGLGFGGGEVALGHRDGGPLQIDLHLEGFRVDADEQVAFLHAVVVIEEDFEHLAGHARGDEGDVAVDVRVVRGDRGERPDDGRREVVAQGGENG
jgi:hypothetical protein